MPALTVKAALEELNTLLEGEDTTEARNRVLELKQFLDSKSKRVGAISYVTSEMEAEDA